MAKRTPKHDIKVWLAERGKPQAWLAAKLGVGQSTLSQILSGYSKPSPSVAKAIKRLTGVTVPPPSVSDPPTVLTEAR